MYSLTTLISGCYILYLIRTLHQAFFFHDSASSHGSSCGHSSVTISLNHKPWSRYTVWIKICLVVLCTPYHSMVGLRVCICRPLKCRENIVAIITASHADAKAHITSSATQCGLRNFVLWPQRASVHFSRVRVILKIMQEAREPLPLDLRVTLHRPHVCSHSWDGCSKHPALPNSFQVGENMHG